MVVVGLQVLGLVVHHPVHLLLLVVVMVGYSNFHQDHSGSHNPIQEVEVEDGGEYPLDS